MASQNTTSILRLFLGCMPGGPEIVRWEGLQILVFDVILVELFIGAIGQPAHEM